jgi:rod shape-determining protein MreD
LFSKGVITVKKFPLLFLISILFIIIQHTFIWKFGILGVLPDIVFVYIVCFSLIRNEVESIAIALFTGIVRDSFFPGIFGINTIVYILTAYMVGKIQKRVYRDSIIVPLFINFGATYLKGFINFGYFYLLSYKYDFSKFVLETNIIESLYNSLISIIIYKMILKYNESKFLNQDWKF